MEDVTTSNLDHHHDHYNSRPRTPVSPLPLPAAISPQTLQRRNRYDAYDLGQQNISPVMSRSPSAASDRYSSVSGLTAYFPSNPTNVNPLPAYVAPFGASQVVSENQTSKRHPLSDDEYEDEPSKDDVQFSEPALALVNSFLDQLLYSFLSSARSTSLLALRPAVTDVLKHRLAREAIASAEEELAELLAGGDDEEEMDTKHKAAENNRKWDLELVWKRTRLRVMVYMRLGEMEDDDEQRYVKEEDLFHGNERRFSQSTGLVSWAAAIFLTSVLEYVAEQTLQVAGQAAFTRVRRKSQSQRLASPSAATQKVEDVVVEEHDVEKVALNSTLGRLWRTWRKVLRNNTGTASPNKHSSYSRISRENMASVLSHRSSFGTPVEGSVNGDSGARSRSTTKDLEDLPEMEYPEHVLAANIPLPMGDHNDDVDEIEAHEPASDADAEDNDEDTGITMDVRNSLEMLLFPTLVLAANKALPIGNEKRDVDEIEIPGLARDPDAEDDDDSWTMIGKEFLRRNSFAGPWSYRNIGGLPTPDQSNQASPAEAAQEPALTRLRSTSVPAPTRAPMLTENQPVLHDSTEEVDDEVEEPGEPRADGEETTGDKQDQKAEDGESETTDIEEPTAHVEDVEHKEPTEEGAEQKSETDRRGLIGGVIVGASAVAAAATAMVYGSKEKEGDPVQTSDSADKMIDSEKTFDWTQQRKSKRQSAMAWPGSTKFEGVSEDERADDGKGKSADRASSAMSETESEYSQKSKDVVDGKEDVPERQVERTRTDEEIAELDKRKSLLDIKAIMVQSNSGRTSGCDSPQPQVMDSRRVSVKTPDSPPIVVRTSSSESGDSGESKKSYTLGNKDKKNITEEISEEEGPEDAIGVARTSDTPAALSDSKQTASPGVEEEQQARDASKRPARLVLGASPKESKKDSPTIRQTELDIYESSFDARTRSPQSQSPKDQTRSVARQPSRKASLANGAQQSPAVEKSPHRQSFTAAVEKNGPRAESKSDPSVQEHPVVQRMASLKGTDRRPTGESGKDMPLTSAAIRGPEDFDMFVQGGDTLKYTLTPEGVRDDPTKSGARQPVEMDATSQPGKQQPPPPPDTRAGRSQTSKQATSATAGPVEDDDTSRKQANRRSISRPPPRNLSAHRRSGLVAREPRVMTESTRDFADFIRSTGPNKESSIYPILPNASTTSLNSLRSAHINGASASRSSSPAPGSERTRSFTRSGINEENVPPVPPIPGKAKNVMQPRGPTSVATGQSELIDFIRSGPDENGNHRISRTVAPFRSTMDSDQLNDLGDRPGTNKPLDVRLDSNNATAPSFKSATSMKSSSHRTSINSRSALLNNSGNANKTVHPAHSGQTPRLSSDRKTVLAQDGEPVRKRHRNKDPYAAYALDLDSEDDDHLTALPKNQRQEESLMDFLNNHEPPSDNSPRPLATGANAQPRSTVNKSRTNSINSQKVATPVDGRSRSMQNPTGPKSGYAASVQSVQSTRSAVASRQAQINSTVTAPGGVKPKMEARAPGGMVNGQPAPGQGSTNELADFLKNSGPEDPDSAPAPIVGRNSKVTPQQEKKAQKAQRRLSVGFFSRAKKK